MKAPSWFENSQAVGVVYLWGLLDTEKGSESGQSNPSGVSLYRATRCSDGFLIASVNTRSVPWGRAPTCGATVKSAIIVLTLEPEIAFDQIVGGVDLRGQLLGTRSLLRDCEPIGVIALDKLATLFADLLEAGFR